MIHNQIITYGLTDEEINKIQNVKPNKDCLIIKADCATDIIAITAYVAIVRKSELSQDDYDMLSSYLEDVGDYTDTVIIIGEENKLTSFSKKINLLFPSIVLLNSRFRRNTVLVNNTQYFCCTLRQKVFYRSSIIRS